MTTHESGHSNPDRKTHHLDMAISAQVGVENLNHLFDYEPILSGFPKKESLDSLTIGRKSLKAPMWISSMTGGTGKAGHINKNLARAAKEFGLGLGLGSCRPLLDGDEFFDDFHLRKIAGDDVVIFANFGVAQVEESLQANGAKSLIELIKKLEVDGVFVHVNPLQEWFQPEGDRWYRSSLEIISEFRECLEKTGLLLGVKEVGQGMGPGSLAALWDLGLDLIEFGAFGGTNFSQLEAMRAPKYKELKGNHYSNELCYVGHSANEMVRHVNCLIEKNGKQGPSVVVSGGVHSSLLGYYLLENLKADAAFGMAKPFLENAVGDYADLASFVEAQLDQYRMAKSFLRARPLA